MADEQYTFTQARNRLDDIVVQVRKKDVSLEHSLDLLEEGVKLAAMCTELIDHTEWRAVAEELAAEELSAEARAVVGSAEEVTAAEEGAQIDAGTAHTLARSVDETAAVHEAEETP